MSVRYIFEPFKFRVWGNKSVIFCGGKIFLHYWTLTHKVNLLSFSCRNIFSVLDEFDKTVLIVSSFLCCCITLQRKFIGLNVGQNNLRVFEFCTWKSLTKQEKLFALNTIAFIIRLYLKLYIWTRLAWVRKMGKQNEKHPNNTSFVHTLMSLNNIFENKNNILILLIQLYSICKINNIIILFVC